MFFVCPFCVKEFVGEKCSCSDWIKGYFLDVTLLTYSPWLFVWVTGHVMFTSKVGQTEENSISSLIAPTVLRSSFRRLIGRYINQQATLALFFLWPFQSESKQLQKLSMGWGKHSLLRANLNRIARSSKTEVASKPHLPYPLSMKEWGTQSSAEQQFKWIGLSKVS